MAKKATTKAKAVKATPEIRYIIGCGTSIETMMYHGACYGTLEEAVKVAVNDSLAFPEDTDNNYVFQLVGVAKATVTSSFTSVDGK